MDRSSAAFFSARTALRSRSMRSSSSVASTTTGDVNTISSAALVALRSSLRSRALIASAHMVVTRRSSSRRSLSARASLTHLTCPPPCGSSGASTSAASSASSVRVLIAFLSVATMALYRLYRCLHRKPLAIFVIFVTTSLSACSRASSSFVCCRLRMKTLVCPMAHWRASSSFLAVSASHSVLWPLAAPCRSRQRYRNTNSSNFLRTGKPILRMRHTSSRPAYRSCASIMSDSKMPPFFWWLDFMQRTKCGSHRYSAVMRPASDSLNCRPSVLVFALAFPPESSVTSARSSRLMRLHLDEFTTSVRSSLSASLFFSRNAVTLYGTAPA